MHLPSSQEGVCPPTAVAFDCDGRDCGLRTIMFRQLPRTCSVHELVAELLRFVEPGHFDFVYVPWVTSAPINMGYAFINFCDSSVALTACRSMAGQRWAAPWMSHRLISLKPAFTQGLAANLRRFRENGVCRGGLNLQSEPLVFRGGVQISLSLAVTRCCQDDAAGKGAWLNQANGFQAQLITDVDFFEPAMPGDCDGMRSTSMGAPVPESFVTICGSGPLKLAIGEVSKA
mmetsp:Transcript_93164/g.268100  ORF Transcript_93164/g.268100 Transcript_93164/m.268100 type:complete len:231 (+) Transcript_93164:53-745(+)|eukprot:CAMPEP_0170299710 /NCGR_PEP_ID=MMETSP0116_2-20130129/50064_1 /TAXON_ID=400756 /ORGANISM="Durinskia baltica, Strain CSIRO CS-38" /LENGTH=230 /DNA_ID=CAMNT_0010551431 /DNA_START=33 /DNA_END=725 /DNA_ORIENTATION=+